jgi:2-polyprenyl-6-methoxyphenol hydroxylase-like FAD-dependent oxidoreductase
MQICIQCRLAVMTRTVLISGAGVAGPALAHLLAEQGLGVTVVERVAGARSSGTPVDVRGPALAVAARLGVMDQLRAADTGVGVLRLVDGSGRRIAELRTRRTPRPGAPGAPEEVELPRGDLARILQDAGRDRVEYVLGDRITALEQDDAGVDVTFATGVPRRFDLVVGADGLHSGVRRAAFGPEERFVHPTGLMVATLGIDTAAPDAVEMHNEPGRALAVHPAHGQPIAAFMFRSDEVVDPHDIAAHRALLRRRYAGSRWRAAELVTAAQTGDLWLDAVSMVRTDRWSAGRVVLLGDAASCVSLFGDGSSLAMTGAATLADALAAHPGDHATAFARYQAAHRPRVLPKQAALRRASSLLVPRTRAGLALRDLGARAVNCRAA